MGIVMYPLLRYCHVGNWSLLQPHLGLILYACLGFVFSTLQASILFWSLFYVLFRRTVKYIDSFRLHFISIFRHRFKEQLGFVSRNMAFDRPTKYFALQESNPQVQTISCQCLCLCQLKHCKIFLFLTVLNKNKVSFSNF